MARAKKRAPILDQTFVWIPAASHDADSTLFRERQRERIARAQENATEAAAKVAPIKRRMA
jgi:hypothetical protein